MSHITKSSTQFKCEESLKKALESMKLELVKAVAGRKVSGRGYNGAKTEGDMVARLKGPYDVAFNRQPDQTLEAATDWYAGHVAAELGTDFSKLKQNYNEQLFTKKAKLKGHFVSRTVRQDGSVKLTITGGKL